MRRLLFVVALMVAATFSIYAQKPWVEHDLRQQQRVLTNPDIPHIVKGTLSHLEDITECEREELWSVVTSAKPARKLLPLYLYIYEVIRRDDAMQAEDDVAMVGRYTDYFLKLWSKEEHHYDIYNYAYAIALQRASKHKRGSTNALIHRLHKRRYARKYGSVVTMLCDGIAIAEQSIEIGGSVALDDTPYERLSMPLREVSAEKYSSVVGKVEAMVLPSCAERHIDMMMRNECMMWQGSYNTIIEQNNLGKETSIIYRQSMTTDDIVIVDANGETLALPSKVYVTPGGVVYALAIDEDNNLSSVVICDVEDGVIRAVGICSIELSTFIDAKCVGEGLYFHLADKYLFVDSSVL